MALNSYFTFWKLNFGLWTIVIGHATFCVVVVYNNVIARLRRVPGSLTEASMDLGADGLQTFRYVTFPTISTALISGALLAFALSFDEVIVTTFTAGAQNTLPIWIFGQIRLGQQLPAGERRRLPGPRRYRSSPSRSPSGSRARAGSFAPNRRNHGNDRTDIGRAQPRHRRGDRLGAEHVGRRGRRGGRAREGGVRRLARRHAEGAQRAAAQARRRDRGQRRGARADRVAQRRQADRSRARGDAVLPSTTCASSPARRATSRASRRASTSPATRRSCGASRSASSPASARGTTR